MNISMAINSLCPEAEFIMENENYSTIQWLVEPERIPTLEELNVEKERLSSLRERTTYQRLRAPEYPSIGDQLDALFHAGVFPPEMAAKIQAVKDKYPKGL